MHVSTRRGVFGAHYDVSARICSVTAPGWIEPNHHLGIITACTFRPNTATQSGEVSFDLVSSKSHRTHSYLRSICRIQNDNPVVSVVQHRGAQYQIGGGFFRDPRKPYFEGWVFQLSKFPQNRDSEGARELRTVLALALGSAVASYYRLDPEILYMYGSATSPTEAICLGPMQTLDEHATAMMSYIAPLEIPTGSQQTYGD